ncbi:MAG: UbiD family decarboxylase [Alphaproteobacteria bacterium]|nr:UbiD family decarboxylase [Alphaproteobacteria bacterium]
MAGSVRSKAKTARGKARVAAPRGRRATSTRARWLDDSDADAPSLRSWMRDLDRAGLLRRVSAEVDWKDEIGALARINLGLGGPALVFETIKGHTRTRCTRLMTCGLGTKAEVLLVLGLLPDTTDRAVVRHLKDTYRKPIPPVMVKNGPVKENILRGLRIDLGQFPAARWHPLDGGRFLDTYCGVVTHDPRTNRPNIGIYRGQVLGRDRIGKLLVPSQGWGNHFSQHRASRAPMPVAVVHGWHDVLPFCAGSPFPMQVCEWDMMGAILGEPVRLVACETVPLAVPASAEIVVEGYIDPDPKTFAMEGPFAEYPGYSGGKPSPKPVLRVTAITHRDDPTLRGALEGARPGFPSEDSLLCCYSWSAIAWNMLEDAGVVGVTDVWMPPVSTGVNIIVQIRKRYRGHAQQVANALWGTSAGQWFFKNVTVVEEDIDIRDPQAVEWAIAFRVNAGKGQLLTFGPTFGSVLDPSTPVEEANVPKYGTGLWTRVLIDATRSWEYEPNPGWGGRRFPPVNTIPSALEAKIKARWAEYGIGIPYLSDEKRELLTFAALKKILPDF